MEEARREFQDLKRVYDQTRGGTKESRLLDTVIARHALVMIDLARSGPRARDPLVARLKDIQEAWTNILLYRAGQNTKNTRDRVTDREFRFQRTVYAMVDEFLQLLLGMVLGGGGGGGRELIKRDWIDFYGLLSPSVMRFYKETMQKFHDYVLHVYDIAQFKEFESSHFFVAASACVVAGSNLGSWLDLIL